MSKETIRNIFISICCSAIAGLAIFYIVQNNQLHSLQQQRENLKSGLINLRNYIAQTNESIEWYQKEQEDLSKFFLKEEDAPAFLEKITNYAKQASVAVVDAKIQSFYQVNVPKKKEDAVYIKHELNDPHEEKQDALKKALTLTAMPVEVRTKGKFASLVKFIDFLQGDQPFSNIVRLEIKSTAAYPLLDCQMTVCIYSLKTLADWKRK